MFKEFFRSALRKALPASKDRESLGIYKDAPRMARERLAPLRTSSLADDGGALHSALAPREEAADFQSSDGRALLDSQVQNLVQAMASFAPAGAGETMLHGAYARELHATIVAGQP